MQKFTTRQIEAAVANRFQMTPAELRAHRIARRYSGPRDIAFYLARRLTGSSYPSLGRKFERNSTTIIHGCRRAARRVKSSENVRRYIKQIWRILQKEGPQPVRRIGVRVWRHAGMEG